MEWTRKHQWLLVVAVLFLFLFFFAYDRMIRQRNVYILSQIQSSQEETVESQRAQSPSGSNAIETKTADDPMIYVHIEGAVNQPGVYQLPLESRVIDLVELAGGLSDEAAHTVNMAQKLRDEMFVIVPFQQVSSGEEARDQSSLVFSPTPENAGTSSLVNINTADQQTLESLTGIGPVLARAILDHRTREGPFQHIEDLKNVSGIGQVRFESLQSQITVH